MRCHEAARAVQRARRYAVNRKSKTKRETRMQELGRRPCSFPPEAAAAAAGPPPPRATPVGAPPRHPSHCPAPPFRARAPPAATHVGRRRGFLGRRPQRPPAEAARSGKTPPRWRVAPGAPLAFAPPRRCPPPPPPLPAVGKPAAGCGSTVSCPRAATASPRPTGGQPRRAPKGPPPPPLLGRGAATAWSRRGGWRVARGLLVPSQPRAGASGRDGTAALHRPALPPTRQPSS